MDKTRSEEAAARKRCGKYNCAQAVAGLYADMVGMDEETINAAVSAFGSGMGTMEGTCGALVGAGMIVGLNVNDRVKSREVMKEILTEFQRMNGATICSRLKGIEGGKVLRDCPGCCADAAAIMEDKLGIVERD